MDESLSPVIEILDFDREYEMKIPFQILYRSNTREIRARASRDGIKWVNLPTHGGISQLNIIPYNDIEGNI